MIKAVIFDLDDTLYPEHAYVESGFKAVDHYLCRKHRVDGFYSVASQLFSEGQRGNIFNKTLEFLNFSYWDEFIKELVDVYRNHTPAIHLDEETTKVLQYFAQHYKTALITDGYQSAQRNKIEALGIAHYFDFICVTDELGREFWKPHEKPYAVTQAALNVDAAECVYVADNPNKDFVTPKKLGWLTVHVLAKGGEYSFCEVNDDYKADIQIESLSALKGIID